MKSKKSFENSANLFVYRLLITPKSISNFKLVIFLTSSQFSTFILDNLLKNTIKYGYCPP